MSTAARRPSSYLFTAIKPDGGRAFGMRRAQTERALYEQLRRERLVPLRTWTLPAWLAPETQMALKDQAELNTQMHQLLSRGVPLVETLEVCASAVSPRTRPTVEQIREQVASGTSFSDSCANTGAFDAVTVAVYKASERTGDLAGAAKQLATNARRQLAVSGKAATLMIYPAIVLTISVLVSLGLLMEIVPRVGNALKSSNVKLPTITTYMITVGEALKANILYVLLAAAVAAFLAVASRKQIKALVMRVMRSLPLLKDVVVAQESTRFFTVMSAMSRSGVPLADALGVAVQAVTHPKLSAQISTLRMRLIEGGVLRLLIDSVTALPFATRRLLIATERSGDLQTAFDGLAQDMADEVDKRSARLLAALEPLLIVVMFLMVGSLLLSIMIPMMQAASNVQT